MENDLDNQRKKISEASFIKNKKASTINKIKQSLSSYLIEACNYFVSSV